MVNGRALLLAPQFALLLAAAARSGDGWPALPTDAQIEQAKARLIADKTADKPTIGEIYAEAAGLGKHEQSLHLARRTIHRYRMGDEVLQSAVSELTITKMHHPRFSDPAESGQVVATYTVKRLLTDFRSAVQRYNANHPGSVVHRSARRILDNSAQTLSWLFTEGGMSATYSRRMVFNRTPPEQRLAGVPAGHDQGTEPGLVESMRALAAEKGKLNPGDVLYLALDHRKGNINEALLLAHNTMRSLARAGDYGLTAVSADARFLADNIEEIREGDNAGPWYHLFGTAYFEAESRGNINGLRLISWMNDLGSEGISRLKQAMAMADSGRPTTDVMSALANIGEQIYREKLGGRIPDPAKWCFNLWGAQLASALLSEVGGDPAPSVEWPRYPGAPIAVGPEELPEGAFRASGGHKIALCPVKIHWRGASRRMSFDLTTGAIEGEFPVSLIPIFEKDGTVGVMWTELEDVPHSVTFEAVRDGTIRFGSVSRATQRLAVYESPIAPGETLALADGRGWAPEPLISSMGATLRPVIVRDVFGNQPAVEEPAPAESAPAPDPPTVIPGIEDIATPQVDAPQPDAGIGYRCEIGAQDVVNSTGKRLARVKDVLRQDRANYHAFGVRHPGDRPGETFFATKVNRELFERLPVDCPPDLAAWILRGAADVVVRVHPDRIEVRPARQ